MRKVKQTDKFKERRAEARKATQFSSTHQPPVPSRSIRNAYRTLLHAPITEDVMNNPSILDTPSALQKLIGHPPVGAEQIAFATFKKAIKGSLRAIEKITVCVEGKLK